MGKSEMFERLASKEEESNRPDAKFGVAAATGAVIGGSLPAAREYKDAKRTADLANKIDGKTYLAKKDKNIRYQYSQAQSNAIRDRISGLNAELGLPANKENWTQRQQELRKAQVSKINQSALDRRQAYFHPDEVEFVNDGFLNDSRRLRGADHDSLLHQLFGDYRNKPHFEATPTRVNLSRAIPRIGYGALIGAAGVGGMAQAIHHMRQPEMERTAQDASLKEALQEPTEDALLPVAGGAGVGLLAARSKLRSLEEAGKDGADDLLKLLESSRVGAGIAVGAGVGLGASHLLKQKKQQQEHELARTATSFFEAMEKFANVAQQAEKPDSESRVPQYVGGVAAGAGIGAGAGAFAGRNGVLQDIAYHNQNIEGLTSDAILDRYYLTKLKDLKSHPIELEKNVNSLIEGAKQNLGGYFGGEKQREIMELSNERDAARALEAERLPGYRHNLLTSLTERGKAVENQTKQLHEAASRLKPATIRGAAIGGGIGALGAAGALAGYHHLQGGHEQ